MLYGQELHPPQDSPSDSFKKENPLLYINIGYLTYFRPTCKYSEPVPGNGFQFHRELESYRYQFAMSNVETIYCYTGWVPN